MYDVKGGRVNIKVQNTLLIARDFSSDDLQENRN